MVEAGDWSVAMMVLALGVDAVGEADFGSRSSLFVKFSLFLLIYLERALIGYIRNTNGTEMIFKLLMRLPSQCVWQLVEAETFEHPADTGERGGKLGGDLFACPASAPQFADAIPNRVGEGRYDE